MKCCKLCDNVTDSQMSKINGARSIFSPLLPLGMDNFTASASLIVNSPQLKDVMMAACLLRGKTTTSSWTSTRFVCFFVSYRCTGFFRLHFVFFTGEMALLPGGGVCFRKHPRAGSKITIVSF